MDLIDDDNLGENIIAGNKCLRTNIIMESRDSVLSSLHIVPHTGDKNIGYNQEK